MSALVANWKIVVFAVLVLALGAMTKLYLDTRDELTTFVAQVEQAGRDAQDEKARTEARHAANLEKVKAEYESNIPEIRAGAVANYRAAHRLPKPAADRRSVPDAAPGVRLDDDAERQCVPDDAFIENAAEDAAKLAAWIGLCQRNNCPVED